MRSPVCVCVYVCVNEGTCLLPIAYQAAFAAVIPLAALNLPNLKMEIDSPEWKGRQSVPRPLPTVACVNKMWLTSFA